MNEMELMASAREKLKGYCRVCPKCNGRACAGEVPGMGGVLSGTSFINNVKALAMYNLNMRTIHQVTEPDVSIRIFGRKFEMPVFVGPVTGVSYNLGGIFTEADMTLRLVEGALAAGSFAFTGDGAEEEVFSAGLEALRSVEGAGIPIIKPRQIESIIERLRQAEAAGVFAAGIDVDGAGLLTMALKGHPVAPKTFYQLRELVQMTELPFILKGIMTSQEAEMAVEIGASAIVVSNHGGRVLDYTPGVAEVLPEIVERVKGEIFVFADGGVRSGVDVLKMLALGADAVLIGRPALVAAAGGGAAGVRLILDKISSQLRHAMLMTGCANIKAIDYSVIY